MEVEMEEEGTGEESDGSIFGLADSSDIEAGDEDMSEEEFKARYEVAKEDTTCFHCSDKDTCRYAYDPYNTDGDCLADK